MDAPRVVVNQAVTYIGGELLATSKQPNEDRVFSEDISFIIREINGTVGTIPTDAMCFYALPSEKLGIGYFKRLKFIGQRDFFYHHSLIFTRYDYELLDADPQNFEKYFIRQGVSELQRKLAPITVYNVRAPIDLKKITNIIRSKELLSSILCSLVLAAYKKKRIIMILEDDAWTLIRNLLMILPMQLRFLAFSTYASKPSKIFDLIAIPAYEFRQSFYQEVLNNATYSVYDLNGQRILSDVDRFSAGDYSKFLVETLSDWVFEGEQDNICNFNKYLKKRSTQIKDLSSIVAGFRSFRTLQALTSTSGLDMASLHFKYAVNTISFDINEATSHLWKAFEIALSNGDIELILQILRELHGLKDEDFARMLVETMNYLFKIHEFGKAIELINKLCANGMHAVVLPICTNAFEEFLDTQARRPIKERAIEGTVNFLVFIMKENLHRGHYLSDTRIVKMIDLARTGFGYGEQLEMIRTLEARLFQDHEQYRKLLLASNPALVEEILRSQPFLATLISHDILSEITFDVLKKKTEIRRYYTISRHYLEDQLVEIYIAVIRKWGILEAFDEYDYQILEYLNPSSYEKVMLAAVDQWNRYVSTPSENQFLEKLPCILRKIECISTGGWKKLIQLLSEMIYSKYETCRVSGNLADINPSSFIEFIIDFFTFNHQIKVQLLSEWGVGELVEKWLLKFWQEFYNKCKKESLISPTVSQSEQVFDQYVNIYKETIQRPYNLLSSLLKTEPKRLNKIKGERAKLLKVFLENLRKVIMDLT